MPLDGTEMFQNPALAKLWEVECLLATENQWCKGRLRDRRGRHCLVGAIVEVNGRPELTRPLIQAIKEISGKHYWRIESFNDDPNTSHQDVLRVLNRARLVIVAEIARADQPRVWYLRLLERIGEVLSISAKRPEFCGAEADWVAANPAATTVGSGSIGCSDRYVYNRRSEHEASDALQ